MPKNKKNIITQDDYFDSESVGFGSHQEPEESKNNDETKAKDYINIEDEEYSSQASYSKIIKYHVEE